MNKLDPTYAFMRVLAMTSLFIHLPVEGQGGGTKITQEQVGQAVRKSKNCVRMKLNKACSGSRGRRRVSGSSHLRRRFWRAGC